jgi:hypothetical protein
VQEELVSLVLNEVVQIDYEGNGSGSVGHFDAPVDPIHGSFRAFSSKLVDGLDDLGASYLKVGNLDPVPVQNDIVPIHEMEIVAFQRGNLGFTSGVAAPGGLAAWNLECLVGFAGRKTNGRSR